LQLADLSKQHRHPSDDNILHVVAVEIRIESEVGIVTDAGRKVARLAKRIDHKSKLLTIRWIRKFPDRVSNRLCELCRMQEPAEWDWASASSSST
jgi:hypothetical protein